MTNSTNDYSGVLNIDKPEGITSHDVVDHVRELTRVKRVGHSGTLDPFATGVLIVAVGSATRLLEYTHDLRKAYEATFILGATSDTDDVAGEIKKLEIKKLSTTVIAKSEIPTLCSGQAPQSRTGSPRLAAREPRDDNIRKVLTHFIGTIKQVPPTYSAVKVKGKKLYEYAREGEDVERSPRKVTIYDIKLKRYEYPELELEITCGSGTYIRALARDIGGALGTGAYVSKLRRTAIGPFTIQESVKLNELTANNLISYLLPPEKLVEHLPSITLTDDESQKIRQGVSIKLWRSGLRSLKTPYRSPLLRSSIALCGGESRGGPAALFNQAHCLIGIGQYESETRQLYPKKTF